VKAGMNRDGINFCGKNPDIRNRTDNRFILIRLVDRGYLLLLGTYPTSGVPKGS
jgi:hypothetical protein